MVCPGMHLIREKWCHELNVLAPKPEPGGWSCEGQPQDQVHHLFKQLNDRTMKDHLGFCSDLFARKAYPHLELTGTGQVRKQTSVETAIEVALHNWFRLPNVLFLKAWVRTGHISMEQALEVGGVTEEDWDNCKLLEDPFLGDPKGSVWEDWGTLGNIRQD